MGNPDRGAQRDAVGEKARRMFSLLHSVDATPSFYWERELPRENLRFGSRGLDLARLIACIWLNEVRIGLD